MGFSCFRSYGTVLVAALPPSGRSAVPLAAAPLAERLAADSGAAALALILFLWASTIPIPGSEGPMLWTIQAACLTLGAGVVELVLKLKRRL